jgi:hypothetical protein
MYLSQWHALKKCQQSQNFSPENLESAKELMGYFLTCEELLKGCVNGSNHKEN